MLPYRQLCHHHITATTPAVTITATPLLHIEVAVVAATITVASRSLHYCHCRRSCCAHNQCSECECRGWWMWTHLCLSIPWWVFSQVLELTSPFMRSYERKWSPSDSIGPLSGILRTNL